MFKLKYLKYKKKYLDLKKNLKIGGMNAPNELHNAIINDQWLIAKDLIQNNANLEAEFEGKTPLIIAIENDRFMIARDLIQNNANLEAEFEGKTPLIIAVENDRFSIARELIERGANTEVQFNGKTPLIIAIENNRFLIARELIQNNANPNVIDLNSGDSALFIAVKGNFIQIVNLLLNRRANIFFRNNGNLQNQGKSIFDYIIDNNLNDIIRLDSFRRIQALFNITNEYGIPEELINKILGYL